MESTINIKNDLSIDYLDKKLMTPARNNAVKPTAVKRNPSDQKIT